MTDRREPSHPPSDPRLSFPRKRPGGPALPDRPVRVQLVAALLLGFLLLASGLYVWHRPHTSDTASAADAETTPSVPLDAAPGPSIVDAGPPPVAVTEARTLGCHDRGPKKTAPEDCDRLPPLEQAVASAIEHSASCIPAGVPGGTIEYVVDVSFSRHKVRVALPRAGRSIRDRKVVSACAAAVREQMASVAVDGLSHQHARYQIAVTATYRGVDATERR